MIPDDELSTTAVVSGFSFPVKQPGDFLVDWELAGIYLNDPSAGLEYKLWKVQAVPNEVSGLVDVVLSAPGGVTPTEATTVLFSYADITEVALSFDQNMNPFVAYLVGGVAKIYWYDSLIPGMTHTALPTGVKDMRCTLDDKRDFAVGDSDIVLSYVRDGNLCMRYQRDRYTIEYVLRSGIGDNATLVSMAMNNAYRLQWRLRNYELTDDPGALFQNSPFLAEVVADLCRKSGIGPENFNVSELWNDVVPGIKISSTDGFGDDIDRLREMFNFDKSNRDRVLAWPKRGRGISAWIPYSDLLASSDEPLAQTLVDEQKLPREIHIEHIDPDGGYAKNKQTARRRSNLVKAEKSESISSGLVVTADQAASAVLQKLKVRWNEQVTFKFTTTLKYTFLVPSDVVMVEDAKGVWHRVRLEERNEDEKQLDWEAIQDAGARAYGSEVIGSTLPPPKSTTPGTVGETRFELLNIPVQRGSDDELGLYLAACGSSSGWSGYQLLFSTDEGASYSEAFQSQNASIIGDTLTPLLAEPLGYAYPSSQTVEVLVNFPLSSVSPDQITQRKNMCVVGDEVMQFETAALLEQIDGKYRYLLSGLRRGRFNTVADTWPQDTRFVFLDASVIFAPIDRVYLGSDLWYKPVSLGATSDETVPTAYMFTEGVSQTEYPVSRVQATRDGSDNVTVSWVGAARLGLDSAPYHSKYFRGYRVKFSDTYTVDTLDTTITYNSAPTGATVQVCALNAITGEGPYSTALAT